MNYQSHKKIFLCLLLLITLTVLVKINTHGLLLNSPKFEDNDLTIFKNYFFYKEKPIHPGIIEKFSPSIADSWKPKTISIDIMACTNTNEFYKEFEWSQARGILTCSLKREANAGYFRYVWLGKLDNGLHVIKTIDDSPGSGTFVDLLFLGIATGKALTPEGSVYSQLLLTFVRNYTLGDRYNGEIRLSNNKVFISPSKSESNQKEIILYFPENLLSI